jgi:hypothetical protein
MECTMKKITKIELTAEQKAAKKAAAVVKAKATKAANKAKADPVVLKAKKDAAVAKGKATKAAKKIAATLVTIAEVEKVVDVKTLDAFSNPVAAAAEPKARVKSGGWMKSAVSYILGKVEKIESVSSEQDGKKLWIRVNGQKLYWMQNPERVEAVVNRLISHQS